MLNGLSKFDTVLSFERPQFSQYQSGAKLNPLFTTVKYWVAEFQRDGTSCQNKYRNGRLNEVTTSEMVKKIHKMVFDHR